MTTPTRDHLGPIDWVAINVKHVTAQAKPGDVLGVLHDGNVTRIYLNGELRSTVGRRAGRGLNPSRYARLRKRSKR